MYVPKSAIQGTSLIRRSQVLDPRRLGYAFDLDTIPVSVAVMSTVLVGLLYSIATPSIGSTAILRRLVPSNRTYRRTFPVGVSRKIKYSNWHMRNNCFKIPINNLSIHGVIKARLNQLRSYVVPEYPQYLSQLLILGNKYMICLLFLNAASRRVEA